MSKRSYLLLVLTLIFPVTGQTQSGWTGFYWGLGIGQSDFSYNQPEIVSTYDFLSDGSQFEENATTFEAFVGTQFDQYLGIEGIFSSVGDVIATSAGRKYKLFDVTTVAIVANLSERFGESSRIFGRFGVHLWDIAEPSGDLDTISSGTDLTYGLGVDINIYDSADRQLRVLWSHYEFDQIQLDESNTLTFSLLFGGG
jgi:OOP family OmpA-OmpF porin